MNTYTWRQTEHVPVGIKFADKFGRIHVRESAGTIETLGYLNVRGDFIWEFDESREYLDTTVVEMDDCDVFDAYPYYAVDQ